LWQTTFSKFQQTIRLLESASGSYTLVFAIFDESRLVAEIGRFGISRALFFAGMKIVGSLNVFMDLNSLFANGDIGGMRVNPASTIEIVGSVLMLVHGGMGVAAENARRVMVAGMSQGAFGDLWR
jgi:hypothetical protein